MVEPDEQARFAGVDDDATWAGVEVGFHAAAAFGAGDHAAEFGGVHGGLSDDEVRMLLPHLVDEHLKCAHGDQHAAAFGAGEDGEPGERGLHERNGADGTVLAGGFPEDAHAFVVLIGDEDALAVVALEGLAVGCIGAPQEGQFIVVSRNPAWSSGRRGCRARARSTG